MWTDFFVAAAGASAALAGLVFVALSVNIQRILQYPQLPWRAAAAIASLILILVSSMAALIPQNQRWMGVEILVFGLMGWSLEVRSARRGFEARRRFQRPAYEAFLDLALGQLQTLPFIAGAILLVTGDPRGVAWVAAGILAVFICSALSAWILLVEILR